MNKPSAITLPQENANLQLYLENTSYKYCNKQKFLTAFF